MTKVKFILKNIERCLCPGYPVHAGSMCVREKLNKIEESSGVPRNQKTTPSVYCGTGMSVSDDLDPKQPCQ